MKWKRDRNTGKNVWQLTCAGQPYKIEVLAPHYLWCVYLDDKFFLAGNSSADAKVQAEALALLFVEGCTLDIDDNRTDRELRITLPNGDTVPNNIGHGKYLIEQARRKLTELKSIEATVVPEAHTPEVLPEVPEVAPEPTPTTTLEVPEVAPLEVAPGLSEEERYERKLAWLLEHDDTYQGLYGEVEAAEEEVQEAENNLAGFENNRDLRQLELEEYVENYILPPQALIPELANLSDKRFEQIKKLLQEGK